MSRTLYCAAFSFAISEIFCDFALANRKYTRLTIIRILQEIRPSKFILFRVNPEEFIIKAANIINNCKAIAVVKKITYSPTGQTYEADLFTAEEIRGVPGDNAIESEKSLYDLVVLTAKGRSCSLPKTLKQTIM